jgi:glycosyltransferase involved in cell wall biosynthesis
VTTAKTVVVLGSYAPSLILFRGPLIAELISRGYRVVAMAPRIGSDIAGQLRSMGAEPRDVDIENASMAPRATLRSLRALERAFREIRPDAVIAYTIKPVTLGCLAAAKAGVPRIVALITGLGFAFIDGGGLKRRLSRLVATTLYRRALRKAHAIIFQNPDDRAFFRDRRITTRSDAAVVAGSGIDVAHYTPAPLPPGPDFLMIARLLGDKGVREYASAARRLKQAHPAARFRLVGFLDPSPDGISQAEVDGWSDAVEFLGKLDDVRPAIAEARVYVLPSYREGTPRSSLEAMAVGRAVVTTHAVGCRETVEEGVNGFMVPVRDADALAAAMERFIVDPGLAERMGRESRRIAEDKFDVRRVNAALLEAAGL